MSTDTLAAFLRARQDEAAAKSASQSSWDDGYGEFRSRGGETFGHILRHDPDRVLREVEAKRSILDEHFGGPDHEDMWEQCVRHLAAVYRDHPDYDPAWSLERDTP